MDGISRGAVGTGQQRLQGAGSVLQMKSSLLPRAQQLTGDENLLLLTTRGGWGVGGMGSSSGRYLPRSPVYPWVYHPAVGVRGTAHSSEARPAHPGVIPRLRNLKLPYRGSALPLGKCGGGMSGYIKRAESAESAAVRLAACWNIR